MSIQSPLVTYVVLSYNHRKYVAHAIESILHQTFKNIELIVVDDGSSDGSAEFLSEFQKIHHFKLILQKNSGVVGALNAGVAASTGDFVVLHASDDISEIDRTETQVKLFDNNDNYGFVASGITKISEAGDVLVKWFPGQRKVFGFDDFILGKATVPAVACMYRGELIRRLMPLDTSFSFEDVQLYWKVTETGHKCVLDERACVIKYRIVHNSLGRANKQKLHAEFLRFVQQYDYHPQFRAVFVRAKVGLFSATADVDRVEAVRYFCSHRSDLPLILAFKGWVKILLPNFLLTRLRKGY